jgi:hypothetical protein
MYCPYCGVDHDDATVVKSVEHVIPFGLGGSDALTMFTCDTANNNLGSSVDAPFMDFFPIQAKRFFLGLESTKGNAPVLDLGGKGWIDGKETPISYRITAESKELKVAKPSVVKTLGENGQENWQVSGDPAKVMEILKGKVRKQMAAGKTVTLEDGTLLTLDNIDQIFAARTTTTINPSVLKTLHYNHLISIRFFSKVALAMGHLYLGERFSRSAHADALRRNMNAETMDAVTQVGRVWPQTEHVEHLLQWCARPASHTVAIMDGDTPMLLVSLFGEIGGMIPLAPLPTDRLPMFSDNGKVWRIALPSRELTTFSIPELVVERMKILRGNAAEDEAEPTVRE